MRIWRFGLVAVLLVLALALPSWADVLTVNPTANTYNYNNWGTSPTVNHNGETVLWASSDPAHLSSQVTLLKFDLSALSGDTVTSATLSLFNTNQDVGSTITLNAAPVTTPWDPATTTWNLASTGLAWTNPLGGADYDATKMATGSATVTNGYHTWVTVDLTSMIQSIVNNPSTNYGVALYGNAGGPDYRFVSTNDVSGYGSTCWPTLAITYTPEPATMALLAIGGLGLLARRRK